MPTFSAERRELVKALCAVVLTLEDPTKKNKVEAGPKRYKYAKLEEFWPDIREELARNGILATGGPEFIVEASRWAYVIELTHAETGQWVRSCFPLSTAENWKDPQALGSEHSYARRYAVLDILELVPTGEDDDARAAKAVAEGRKPNRAQEPPSAKELRQSAHDPEWEGDRSDFMARLQDFGVKYEDLCLVLAHQSTPEPDPSTIGNKKRLTLIQRLRKLHTEGKAGSISAKATSIREKLAAVN